jgi:hypothetical protein
VQPLLVAVIVGAKIRHPCLLMISEAKRPLTPAEGVVICLWKVDAGEVRLVERLRRSRYLGAGVGRVGPCPARRWGHRGHRTKGEVHQVVIALRVVVASNALDGAAKVRTVLVYLRYAVLETRSSVNLES